MQEAMITTEVFLIAMAIIFYCPLFDLAAGSHRLLRAIGSGANHHWGLAWAGHSRQGVCRLLHLCV